MPLKLARFRVYNIAEGITCEDVGKALGVRLHLEGVVLLRDTFRVDRRGSSSEGATHCIDLELLESEAASLRAANGEAKVLFDGFGMQTLHFMELAPFQCPRAGVVSFAGAAGPPPNPGLDERLLQKRLLDLKQIRDREAANELVRASQNVSSPGTPRNGGSNQPPVPQQPHPTPRVASQPPAAGRLAIVNIPHKDAEQVVSTVATTSRNAGADGSLVTPRSDRRHLPVSPPGVDVTKACREVQRDPQAHDASCKQSPTLRAAVEPQGRTSIDDLRALAQVRQGTLSSQRTPRASTSPRQSYVGGGTAQSMPPQAGSPLKTHDSRTDLVQCHRYLPSVGCTPWTPRRQGNQEEAQALVFEQLSQDMQDHTTRSCRACHSPDCVLQ